MGLAVAAGSDAEPRSFPVAAAASQNDVYPDRVTQFPQGVTGLADVTYSVLPGFRPLVLDLYLPQGTAPQPLIVFVHGGGWVGGNTRHSGALADFPRALAQLAAEGFAVASVEYRLAGEAPFPAALQDVRAALRFLKSNAANYGIDGAKVAVWGGSAGGQLAALAAASCGDQSLDPSTRRARHRVRAGRGHLVWSVRLRCRLHSATAWRGREPLPRLQRRLRCRHAPCEPNSVRDRGRSAVPVDSRRS